MAMMMAEVTRSATKSFVPGEQLVEDLEHDVAVAADEVAGRDEGHRDHRQEREFARADPADRGEVPPEDLVHDAEDDEGEEHDADRDLDRGEDLDEPRVRAERPG